jgi:hypothetical protein
MPFDATLKDLAREHPRDFLAAFDQPPTLPVSLLNVDLSTVTTAADLVVGLGDPVQEIVHIDFQSSASATKHADVLVYNALLFGHYRVPVHSIVVLLRPQAAHSNLSGAVRYAARPGQGKMEFDYEVVRLWEQPAEELLTGNLGTLPLALLGRLPEGVALEHGLQTVLQRLVDRLEKEVPPERARKLLTAAFVLSGLRLRRNLLRNVIQGVRAMPVDMRDSDTYLAIMEEGAVAALHRALLRLGRKRFGEPDPATQGSLKAIVDLPRLERLSERLLDVATWKELLDTP